VTTAAPAIKKFRFRGARRNRRMPVRKTIENFPRRLSSALKHIDPRTLASFLLALRRFLRHRLTVEEAKEEVRRRIDSRAERFLSRIETQVFGRYSNPYRRLFKAAGCELADLAHQVRRYGVEKALEQLAAEGVYLTPDEFKGKREVKRGTESFVVDPKTLDLNVASPSLTVQTSGTSNAPRPYVIPLNALASRAFSQCVFYAAHDLASYSAAVYDAILPANGGVRELLVCARFGYRMNRWFARKVPSQSRLGTVWNEAMTYLIVLMGNIFGPGLPWPEFVDGENVQPIIDWILQEQRRRKSCMIRCTASNAARISRAAWEMGLPLDGSKFYVSGEPFTEAKRDVIARSGATAVPAYGFDGGAIGFGCVHPAYVDDLHVDLAKLALILRPQALDYAPEIHPLLVTTLDETAPRFYLNVDIGDHATISDRRCGCVLEAVGMTQHIHHIRSHEKFTSEGMNYFYGNLWDLLEKSLPSEFGGAPGDYQLVEEEEGDGQTRLVLIVHPRLGSLEEEKLLARLHAALAAGSRANEFQSAVWRNAGTVKIRREIPLASERGKILPLRISHAG
jgi:hypothetical protein